MSGYGRRYHIASSARYHVAHPPDIAHIPPEVYDHHQRSPPSCLRPTSPCQEISSTSSASTVIAERRRQKSLQYPTSPHIGRQRSLQSPTHRTALGDGRHLTLNPIDKDRTIFAERLFISYRLQQHHQSPSIRLAVEMIVWKCMPPVDATAAAAAAAGAATSTQISMPRGIHYDCSRTKCLRWSTDLPSPASSRPSERTYRATTVTSLVAERVAHAATNTGWVTCVLTQQLCGYKPANPGNTPTERHYSWRVQERHCPSELAIDFCIHSAVARRASRRCRRVDAGGRASEPTGGRASGRTGRRALN